MGKRKGTGYGLHSLGTALNNDKVPLRAPQVRGPCRYVSAHTGGAVHIKELTFERPIIPLGRSCLKTDTTVV